MPNPIYVDEDGYAHDDENNSWFVGKGYGGKHHPFRSLPKAPPPKYKVEDTPERRAETNRLILAATASGDTRSALFLIDTFIRYALSDNQIRYRESIGSRLGSLASKMPDVTFVNVYEKRPDILRVERISDADRRRLEPYFFIQDGLDGRSTLQSYRLDPDLKKGPSNLHGAQADAIRRLYERTKNHFLKTTLYSLEDGKTPSSRQMEIVRKIFAENGEPLPDILKGP